MSAEEKTTEKEFLHWKTNDSLLSDSYLETPICRLGQVAFEKNLELIKKYGLTQSTIELLLKASEITTQAHNLVSAINDLIQSQDSFLFHAENPSSQVNSISADSEE